ncbi:hypothetical protein [Dysosmobacter sp.]|mgnify:FL=1|jgi:hypothetical protein|uniref:hypothetical protein n=1 Tax=Dysosmobacter sp. TaxID=2591382 RepID=UPI003D90AB88
MILDSGMLTVYAVSSTEGTAPPPVKHSLVRKLTANYGEKTVGATRYYAAAKVGQQIDRAVRIWRVPGITVRDVCLVDSTYYRIRKVTLTTDEDGLLVTDLDLEDDDGILRGWADESQSQ